MYRLPRRRREESLGYFGREGDVRRYLLSLIYLAGPRLVAQEQVITTLRSYAIKVRSGDAAVANH